MSEYLLIWFIGALITLSLLVLTQETIEDNVTGNQASFGMLLIFLIWPVMLVMTIYALFTKREM
jgi:uncharacterized membrane protein YecN with MAPEG domain